MRFGTRGWWYYFPVAFLVKTPVALIVLALGGIGLLAARKASFPRGYALAIPALAYWRRPWTGPT